MMESSIEFWGNKALKLMRKAGVTLPTFKDMIPTIDELNNSNFSNEEIYQATHNELLKEREIIIQKIKDKAAKLKKN